MRTKVLILMLCLMTITCMSAEKKQTSPKKYDFIIQNFDIGEHDLNPEQYQYLQKVLTFDGWYNQAVDFSTIKYLQ